jgi:hypothetical protein
MKTTTCHQFPCSQCRFFQPDGHYQGSCDRMNVPVKGKWQACHLAVHVFDSFPDIGASMK